MGSSNTIIWEIYVVLTLLMLVICEWSNLVGKVGLVEFSDWMRKWFDFGKNACARSEGLNLRR